MKKILQVAAVDISLYKFVVPLMKELKKEGFEVIGTAKDLGYLKKIEEDGFRTYDLNIDRRISLVSNLKTIVELYKIIKKEKIDIIHLHTPIAAVLGRIAAKLAGVKTIIYTAHGYYNENKLFYTIEKFMGKHLTDYIFTVNEQDKKMAIEEGFIKKENILNINSVGIDTKKFNPEAIDNNMKELLKKELNIEEKDIIIGYVARLVKIKGPVDLLNGFIQIKDKYPNTKLLMIGSEDYSGRDNITKNKIQEIIKTNNIEDRVIFTGHREDIPELMSIMDLFILPSYWEGMPVSLLEAMAMELPVIGTDIRGSREEITKNTGIIYPPGNVDILAQSLEIILKDMDKAREMGKRARCRVVEYFSEEQVLERQMQVFRKI